MSVIEIVGGAILLVVSAVIILLTLMQHTHGQGLAGAINGGVDVYKRQVYNDLQARHSGA